jgi:hypothetical protein
MHHHIARPRERGARALPLAQDRIVLTGRLLKDGMQQWQPTTSHAPIYSTGVTPLLGTDSGSLKWMVDALGKLDTEQKRCVAGGDGGFTYMWEPSEGLEEKHAANPSSWHANRHCFLHRQDIGWSRSRVPVLKWSYEL